MQMIRNKKRRLGDGEGEESSDESDIDLNEKRIRRVGNRVYFYAPVSRSTIAILIDRLHAAIVAARSNICTNQHAEVYLFLHTEGGCAYAGLSGMDHIRNMPCKVICVADGFVASAGTFLLMGGHVRLGMQHCEVLIHQITTQFWGKYRDLKDEMKNSRQLMRRIRSIYSKETNMTREQLRSLLQAELTLSCAKCQEIGLIEGTYDTNYKVAAKD